MSWPASTASATARPRARSRCHKDLGDLPPDQLAAVPQVLGSLDEVLRALVRDHDYLLAGDVFTPDLIDTWISYKREVEIDGLRLRPHPHEFQLYYDI